MKKWNTVAIVGVGLIGGSIGLALRQRRLAGRVVGIGRRMASLRRARKCGCVDAATTHIARGIAGADAVIVCTPVAHIAEHVCQVASHWEKLAPGAWITDAGSTKAELVTQIEKRVATDVPFVGSHPLAGSEKTGPEHARADLFESRVVVVTPTRRTRPADFAAVVDFWSSLGSAVVRMTPKAHDEAVAASSHVPHLVASALAAATPDSALELTAGGWLDATRIAAADPDLWRQILLANRGPVLKSLGKFEKVLSSLRKAIEQQDAAALARLLEAGKKTRDAVGN